MAGRLTLTLSLSHPEPPLVCCTSVRPGGRAAAILSFHLDVKPGAAPAPRAQRERGLTPRARDLSTQTQDQHFLNAEIFNRPSREWGRGSRAVGGRASARPETPGGLPVRAGWGVGGEGAGAARADSPGRGPRDSTCQGPARLRGARADQRPAPASVTRGPSADKKRLPAGPARPSHRRPGPAPHKGRPGPLGAAANKGRPARRPAQGAGDPEITEETPPSSHCQTPPELLARCPAGRWLIHAPIWPWYLSGCGENRCPCPFWGPRIPLGNKPENCLINLVVQDRYHHLSFDFTDLELKLLS
ncbi:uncharacterized protein C11orf96-like [Neofelis nebulosa]|uniref:uncharacterized protein C11orf96-like n=1 Tax=Neofelis nebulosa TaxID=61452 RepID=UPI00272CB695|nr:uncharacterized protein C11orf96-like [Neofelis nebulosa]